MGAHKCVLSHTSLWLTTTIISTFYLVPCFGGHDNQTNNFVSCLTSHKINNFTTYSDIDYYQQLNSSMYNLRFTGPSIPKPTAIVIPSTKEQLVNTVLCSKKMSLEMRVRCGGHSYEGTSSVATDGFPFIIIEMKNLDKISVNVEEEVVWIEGGATLGQTYLAIAQASEVHTIAAGTCPTVGIGGHNSGGGLGHLVRKYGLAADNVVDAILIDAEGRVLDRELMGEEVFWAIRGGGGGVWGIIYAYKMRMVTVPKLVTTFTVTRSNPKHDVASLLHKWQFVAPKLENGFFLVAFVGADLADTIGNHIKIEFEGSYLGPIKDVVSILERLFPELGVTETVCKEMSWIDAMLSFAWIKNGTIYDLANRYASEKSYFKDKYDFMQTPIPMDGIHAVLDLLKKQPKGDVFVEPLGGIMDEIASDSIAFPHRKGTIFGIQYGIKWTEENNEKSKDYIEWVREIYDTMTPFVPSPRGSYVNCMDLDLGIMQNNKGVDEVEMARVWGEKYFLQNYDRLVRAKTIIDPRNVFRHQQGIFPMSTSSITNQLLKSEMKLW